MIKILFRILAFAVILSASACATLGQGSQSDIVITFSNQTSFDLCELYASLEKANDWGENRLGEAEILSAGGEISYALKPGTYDLFARTCSQEAAYSKSGVKSNFQANIGGAGMAPVRAVNTGAVEICHIYIAQAGVSDWGEDQLGRVESILPGGSRLFFSLPGSYNFRAEDCAHNVLSQLENFDPASGSEWIIAP